MVLLNELFADSFSLLIATLPAIDVVGMAKQFVDLGGVGVKAVFQCRDLHPKDEEQEAH
jgi:hypothetical protein